MGHFRRLPIAVLEAAWERDQHLSVKPLFNILSSIYVGVEDGYEYERFVGSRSFDETHFFLCTRPNVRYIYVASHGHEGGNHLTCPNGDVISRTLLRNDLIKASSVRGGRIDGAFYGSCFFGEDFNAWTLLREVHDNGGMLCWVAGYQGSVDWIQSSVLDLMFWQIYLQKISEGKTPRRGIETTADEICRQAEGLASDLQFGIWVRQQRTGCVKNLVAGTTF